MAFALVTWAWHGTIMAAAYCVLAAGMIAVGLIEYGGQRAPVSVAAIATTSAQVIIVVGAGWHHHWWTVGGSLAGTAVALVLYATLRAADPDCADPRGHGRSALLLAGCWVGGLGAVPLAIGAAAWIVTYFSCMVGAWSTARERSATAPLPSERRAIHPILAVPLVSAISVALVASLIAGA